MRNFTIYLLFLFLPLTSPCVTDADVNAKIQQLQQANITDLQRGLQSGTSQSNLGNMALAILALLESNYDRSDKTLQSSIDMIDDPALYSNWEYVSSYTVPLVLYALLDYDPKSYSNEIEKLIETIEDNGNKGNWGDQSRNQYCILGLGMAKKAGFEVNEKVLESSRLLWRNTFQNGWGYQYAKNEKSYLAMTAAGLASLSLLGEELYEPQGRCGYYRKNPVIDKALKSLSDNLRNSTTRGGGKGTIDAYTLYGLERVMIFLDLKELEGEDWYRFGAEMIINGTSNLKNLQLTSSTSWGGVNGYQLLFLAKGFKPMAITKWQWGPENSNDWNNDRNDVRNWIANFNKKHKEHFDWLPSRLEDLESQAAKASMIFVNGHGRFTMNNKEVEFMRSYLEDKGTLIAEACCQKKMFRHSFFKEIRTKLYPQSNIKFMPIGIEHPVYNIIHKISPRAMPVYRMQMGCRKTRVLFIADEFSCALNGEQCSASHKRLSEKLSENILAWAVAHKKADKRLDNTLLEEVDYEVDERPRDAEKAEGIDVFSQPIARILHKGDAGADPHLFGEMRKMLQKSTGGEVFFDAEVPLKASSPSIFSAAMLYITGHSNPKFTLAEMKNLKEYIAAGGSILSVSCCGEEAYSNGIENMLSRMFPNDPLVDIPADDPIYSCYYKDEFKADKSTVTRAYLKKKRNGSIALKGISRNGRWVFVHSPYDICCAIEGDLEEDIIGLRKESAFRQFVNLLYYNLAH